MDPSSLLEAIQKAIAAGIEGYKIYRELRRVFEESPNDERAVERFVDWSDVQSGSSSTAGSGARYPDEIITDTDVVRAGGTVEPGGFGRRPRRKRRKHPPDCSCAVCDERNSDVYAVLGVP